MPIAFHNPPMLFDSSKYGFSQIAVSQCSSFKFFNTSGQVAVDSEERLLGTDLLRQTRHALLNVESAIKAIGGSLKNIMALKIYFVNSDEHNVEDIGIALRDFFGTEAPPASSWIGVSSLARAEFLIEIEASGIIRLTVVGLPGRFTDQSRYKFALIRIENILP